MQRHGDSTEPNLLVDNVGSSTERRGIRLGKLAGFMLGFLGGLISSALSEVIERIVVPEQQFVAQSDISVDYINYREAEAAMRWDCALQPRKQFIFSTTRLVGCFAHIEARANREANLVGFDFSEADGIVIYLKSASDVAVTEFNIFVGGDNYVQYTAAGAQPFRIRERWTELKFAFDEFEIAPWEASFRKGLPTSFRGDGKFLLRNVTAFGMDIKTMGAAVSATLWIDHVRLTGSGIPTQVISSADDITGTDRGTRYVWVAGWFQ